MKFHDFMGSCYCQEVGSRYSVSADIASGLFRILSKTSYLYVDKNRLWNFIKPRGSTCQFLLYTCTHAVALNAPLSDTQYRSKFTIKLIDCTKITHCYERRRYRMSWIFLRCVKERFFLFVRSLYWFSNFREDTLCLISFEHDKKYKTSRQLELLRSSL